MHADNTYQNLLGANVPLVILDREGCILTANALFSNRTKSSASTLHSIHFSTFLSPYFKQQFSEVLFPRVMRGQIWSGMLSLAIDLATTKTNFCTVVPVSETDKEPSYFVLTFLEAPPEIALTEDLSFTLSEFRNYKMAIDECCILSATDKDGVILEVNDLFCRISGYSKEELIGQNHDLLRSSFQTKDESKVLWQTITKGNKWKGEFQNRSKSGRYFWMESIIVPLGSENNKDIRYLAISTDITNRKETEEKERLLQEKLRKQHREFSILLQRINEGFAMLDRNFIFTYTNAMLCEIANKGRDELRDQNIWEAFPEGKDTQLGQMIIDTMNDGEYRQCAQFYPQLNKWLDNHVYAIDEGVSIFTRDITDQKKQELASKKNEYIYKTIASKIPGVQISIIDVHTHITLVEGDLTSKMGLESEKMIGEPIASVFNLDTNDGLLVHIEKAFTGQSSTAEKYIRGFHLQYSVVPLLSHGKKVESVMLVILDVTNLSEAKQQVEELNTQLERKVEIRTLELEHANHELESFSYSVAHDLRTPLRALSGYASMLNSEYSSHLQGEGLRYLKELLYNSEKMTHLIDDLLILSRLGRKELRFADVDMTQLTQSVIQEMRLNPETIKHIKVGPLITVKGDASLLKQVMINLLANAIKYSSKKESLSIAITCEADRHGATFCVEDHGAGFNMNQAHRLFGVFQRLHSEEEFEGTGVGLAIVQRIVYRHKGKVWAVAEPSKGAKFFFTLPTSFS